MTQKPGKRICRNLSCAWTFVLSLMLLCGSSSGADLRQVKEAGVLRHLGVPYVGFVTGSGDGLDVEILKLFAQSIGVRYEFVQTSWGSILSDLCGKKVGPKSDSVDITGESSVRGDVAANGLTILPWREKVVDFVPTFPNQVWLIARADSTLTPIEPTGSVNRDIAAVKAQVRGHSILRIAGTHLDPRLYSLNDAGASSKEFKGVVNELIPAVIGGEADAALQDLPGALAAIEKWPGRIKIIGPVSPVHYMGYAFAKSSRQLRDAFSRFFDQCLRDGTYARIVSRYYPAVLKHYPEFFERK